MITTPVSNGFSGLTSSMLELIRDEFQKSKIFTTAMMEDSNGWVREDTIVSENTSLLSAANSSVIEINQPTIIE